MADDSGDEASANLLVTPVQGPIIEALEASIEGQTVLLEWTYDGPNANFSIERNGVVLEQTEEQNFADVRRNLGRYVSNLRQESLRHLVQQLRFSKAIVKRRKRYFQKISLK